MRLTDACFELGYKNQVGLGNNSRYVDLWIQFLIDQFIEDFNLFIG